MAGMGGSSYQKNFVGALVEVLLGRAALAQIQSRSTKLPARFAERLKHGVADRLIGMPRPFP